MNFGIICEFNPLHKGHIHLINTIKSENDSIICAMSGNYVQRGEMAVFDKYTRAKQAVQNGADLVIEIPTLSSTQSAQGFAKAGIKLLEGTGICESLAFGVEDDSIEELKSLAKEIIEKDNEIKAELKKGFSYPTARQRVINSPLLEKPNNILAIEYLTYTTLNPVAVKRIGKGHDSDDGEYSASEIRKSLNFEDIHSLDYVENAILYKLRTMSAEDFAKIEDVNEGLENRIVECVKGATSLDELYNSIKTKRYTHSRIRRIVLRAFLGITKDVDSEPRYIHILAFNDKGRKLLANMKKTANMPIITKYGNIDDKELKKLFDLECSFTDIYNLACKNPKPCGQEQKSKVEMI